MSAVASRADSLDRAVFLDPGPEYRGVTLWFLNDRLDEAEIGRQLRGFRDAGWGALIARAFMGVRTPYLGPEWIAFSNRLLAEARKLGLRVMLQHADKNAAPYMVSGVPGMEERFRHQLIVAAPMDAAAPERGELLSRDGEKAYYRLAVAPTGDWSRLLAVLDLLDEDTIDAYLAAAYRPLAEHHGHEFGQTVEAIWVDEPWLRIARYTPYPALPWTTDLAARFAQDWGYDLLDHLPELFAPVGDYRRVRHQYWRTVNRRFLEVYWKKVGDWCTAHGTQFAGHLMAEDTLHGQISWTGTVMPAYEHMHIPGIDHLTKNLKSWPAGTPFIPTPKQCSSAANQFGRREVLAEMYGVSDPALSFADRKWMAEWMATLGINYRCYHGSFYTLRGRRKRFYPPYLSEQQPWWPDNRLVADPLARLSYLLRQGVFDADILVLHPLESAHGEFNPAATAPAIKSMQAFWTALSEHLLTIHRAYDYGDEEIMANHGAVADGRLRVGQMAYRVVVLPEVATLRESTFRLLTDLLEAGGTVLAAGAMPSRIDGAEDPRAAALATRFLPVENTPAALRNLLDRQHPADVTLTGPGADKIWLHPRRAGNKRVFFLNNTDRTAGAEVELAVRGSGRLDAWDMVDGKPTPVPQQARDGWLVAPLRFAPGGSHLLVLDETAAPVELPVRRMVETRAVPLPTEFGVARLDPNALVLDFCRCRCGAGEWSALLPVIGLHEKLTAQGYRGPIEQLFTFPAEHLPAACALVIEDSEQCSVTVNGHPVQREGDAFYRDRGFHRLDATGLLRLGENEVRIVRDFVAGDAAAVAEPDRFYGTELEAAYLIGDFAVCRASRTIVAESGRAGRDLLADGYPFYAGRLVLAASLDLPAPAAGERVFLELGPLQAVLAKARLNGHAAGSIAWAPEEVELTPWVRKGANHLEIELVNSLRNLLGPLHNRTPNPFEVWNHHFSGQKERVDWMDEPQRQQLKTWTDEYQLVPLGLAAEARLVYRRESR
ncbi:MAG: glycosyl hydrolase [Lentisphaeria bacterium]|nr:glycosyl hydrolase [Lentisphaeria bacterium]